MRPVSAASQAELIKPVTQPGFFVEMQFASGVVRLSSFGSLTWNSVPWIGANFIVDGLQADGRAARVSIWDPTAAYRTAVMTGAGIRNRPVRIWQAQAGALAAGDPNMIFSGVGDGTEIGQGRVAIGCVRLNSGVLLAPRQRIGPGTGFNFLAAPGRKIAWGDTIITLNPTGRT